MSVSVVGRSLWFDWCDDDGCQSACCTCYIADHGMMTAIARYSAVIEWCLTVACICDSYSRASMIVCATRDADDVMSCCGMAIVVSGNSSRVVHVVSC